MNRNNNFGKTSEYSKNKENSRLNYEADNFDEVGADDYVAGYEPKESERPTDYGDDFDSQTGDSTQSEPNDYYEMDYDDSDAYLSERQQRARQAGKAPVKRNPKKKPKRGNKIFATVFAVAAILCIIGGAIFVMTRCTDDSKVKVEPTSSTSAVKKSTVQPTSAAAAQSQYVADTTAQEASTTAETTEPTTQATEATTVPQTEATTPAPTEAPQTADPQQDQDNQSEPENEVEQSEQGGAGNNPDGDF